MEPASKRVEYPLDKLIERVDYILREWKDESNSNSYLDLIRT